MATVVGYVRISKEEQNSKSLETQESAITDWCERMGHDLVAVFRDEGVSGSVAPMDRKGAAQAIRKARTRQVDIFAVAKLDRIARVLGDTLHLVDTVLGKRAVLVSISEQFDASTPAGRMFLQLLGTFAEFERNRIRERTREALATRRRMGRKTGGTVPFGYRAEEVQLVPNDDEQRTLRRAFALRAEGVSWRLTADALNAEGMTRRGGLPWTASRLYEVLAAERRRREDRATAAARVH